MKNKTLPILILFLAAGIVLSFIFRAFRQPQWEKLPQTAVLTINSDKTQYSQNEEFRVTLTLDSKENEVAAADFLVKFDPKYLKVVKASTGNFFSNYPVNTTGNNYIKISGVASFDGQMLILPKGRQKVADIRFLTLAKSGRTKISLDRGKTIVATNGQNLLDKKQLTDLLIDIQ